MNSSFRYMRKLISKHIFFLVGIIAGAITGYLYYKFRGCVDGTCTISSSPVYSTFYGALVGAVLFYGTKSKTGHRNYKDND